MKKLTSILLLFLTFLFVNVGNADAQQEHEYVDLGLPSGTLWATCNIGANKPWEYGDWFAWGETETKRSVYSAFTYNFNHEYGHNGIETLEKSDDAAYQQWGSDWCMPTPAQFKELQMNCTCEWTNNYQRMGVAGIIFTSDVNDNTIFFPASGMSHDGSRIDSRDLYGAYWTSSLSRIKFRSSAEAFHYAWFFSFGILFKDGLLDGEGERSHGFTVRAVRCNVASQSQTQSTVKQYVDLGLPSGTLWATTNIGAANPEDYGDYFAWGETKPKPTYSSNNYKYCKDDYNHKLTKYCSNSDYGYNGYTDSRTTLDPSDDAAAANWGSDWYIPTQAQFQELKDKCTWTWTTLNGKKGYNVKGPNGKSIFLPAAGYKGRDGITSRAGSYGNYWSSLLSTDYMLSSGCRLLFGSSYINPGNSGFRCDGSSVRPVRSQVTIKQDVDLGLPSGTLWATTNVGATNPWDYGNYFAWGETTTKSTYSWSNYKHGNGSNADVSKKYNNTDCHTTLEEPDDAATANLGSDWCMPTKAQFQELIDNCTCDWTTNYQGKGVAGVSCISKKNGNIIFFPAVGYHNGSDGNFSYVGSGGFYWSSTLSINRADRAECLHFLSGAPPSDYGNRCNGFPVRAVRRSYNATSHVDLGLPSGTLWATTNVGAINPWDYGDYFAWGETDGKKSTYSWDNYTYCKDGDYHKLTKYCNKPSYGNNVFTDSRTTLEKSDDAATANWGSEWCMPTQAQFQELYENCINEWTTNYQGKGVAGRIFKSKKNGNTIFFPAAGWKDGDGNTSNSMSNYWSSSLITDRPYVARNLFFVSGYARPDNWSYRCDGFPVRAVRCSN